MTTLKRPRTNRPSWWTLARRRWAYGVASAAVPVAVTYGLVSQNQAVPLLALAGALLGTTGLALANPTREQE